MTFICTLCGETSKPFEKQFMIITQRRERTYPKAKKIHDPGCGKSEGRKCTCLGHYVDTEGWEIVEQIKVCEDCHEKEGPNYW